MQVLARIPTLPVDVDAVALPNAGPSLPVSTAPCAPASRVRGTGTRPAATRSAIPDWSIAALAAVAIAVWSMAAWRDADDRPDRVAAESPAPSDPAAAHTR